MHTGQKPLLSYKAAIENLTQIGPWLGGGDLSTMPFPTGWRLAGHKHYPFSLLFASKQELYLVYISASGTQCGEKKAQGEVLISSLFHALWSWSVSDSHFPPLALPQTTRSLLCVRLIHQSSRIRKVQRIFVLGVLWMLGSTVCWSHVVLDPGTLHLTLPIQLELLLGAVEWPEREKNAEGMWEGLGRSEGIGLEMVLTPSHPKESYNSLPSGIYPSFWEHNSASWLLIQGEPKEDICSVLYI